MKTIIAGGRDYHNFDTLLVAITEFRSLIRKGDITEVVWGGASGVDAMGKRWAEKQGIPIKPFMADWTTYRKAAGPIRNRQMADYADALIAIWDGESHGTKNMIDEATKRGLVVHVHLLPQPMKGEG